MDFEKLSKERGIVMAIQIAHKEGKLEEKLLSRIDGLIWLPVFHSVMSDNELKKIALEQIANLSLSYDEWVMNLKDGKLGGALRELALQKIDGMDFSFERLVEIYLDKNTDEELKNLAYCKLEKIDESFDKWTKVYESAPEKCRLKNLALRKIDVAIASFEQCLAVFDKANHYDDFGYILADKLVKMARTYEEWLKFYEARRYMDTPELKRLVFINLFKSIQTYWQGAGFYALIVDDEKMQISALDKMIELAQDYQEWFSIHRLVPASNRRLRRMVLFKLCETANTVDHWFEIFDIANEDHDVRERALENIAKIEKSLSEITF